MTIPLKGSATALFPRLGRIGRVAVAAATCQSTISAQLTDLIGRYTDLDEFITGPLVVNRDQLTRGVASALMQSLQGVATATLSEMVRQDQPARVSDPVGELIRQMKQSGESVPKCTVTATATVDATNTGNGVAVITTRRGDGREQENLIAEAGRLTVISDSRTGGQTAGAEQLRYTGVANPSGNWDWDYPQGSGATKTFQSVDGMTGRGSNSRNGGFDAWTGTALDNWTVTGTITKETATTFDSAQAAVRVAAGATVKLTQSFATQTQSPTVLNPLASLMFSIWIRGSAALTGGTLAVALVDGSGTTLLDDQGVSQSVSFALAGTSAAVWTSKTGTLRTPRVMPTNGYALQLTITAPVGGALLLDHLATTAPTALYTGGPGLAVFGGNIPAVSGDGWTVTGTNNRAGAAFGLTWQSVFARLFGDGLILPSSAAPTIPDSLITA